jgi:outer membrane lipoprotein SlyB
MKVRYAEVTDIERVRLPSNAPAGAVVGGFTGLVLSRNSSGGKRVASGLGGAVLGGLATSALEGERLGYSYRVRYSDGSVSNFITEKGYLQTGDCVSVERGQYANIRRVASLM